MQRELFGAMGGHYWGGALWLRHRPGVLYRYAMSLGSWAAKAEHCNRRGRWYNANARHWKASRFHLQALFISLALWLVYRSRAIIGRLQMKLWGPRGADAGEDVG